MSKKLKLHYIGCKGAVHSLDMVLCLSHAVLPTVFQLDSCLQTWTNGTST
eukprot:COSAG02_NODE_2016_length_10101_cov_10.944011_10_plen_50_part_00